MLLDKENNAINNNSYVDKLNDKSDAILYCSEGR